ncbi:MAG: TlpA family protein disulfide reductase [Coriobacteriia bacterium]|nr:TlpA family protein disulfide reductase [Coriobacteriia bacterium]
MKKNRNWFIALIFALLLITIIVGAIALQRIIAPEGLNDVAIADLMPDTFEDPLVGQAAPDIVFTDEAGQSFQLSSFANTPVVLNFWASWCPPCRVEKPDFQQAFEQYGDEVKFVMLNVDESVDVARAYVDEEGYTFPIYFDDAGSGALAYEVAGIPETFIIDAGGTITARFLGATSFATLERAIQGTLP